ncbi:hypothetical protein ACROYT_G042089 [Oculina patagonica]
MQSYASTKESFINPAKATLVEARPLKQVKQEGNAVEKESGRANAAQGSNRALLVLVITVCLISLVVLLLTLLMLFGKIGDGCGCSADEASSAESAKKEAFEKNIIKSLLLGLMERIEDLEKFEIKLNNLDDVLTRLKSALNRTNTDLARLKRTQTKEKVIYHQTMTPFWLEAHASYINSYRLNTTEQLTFIAGPKESRPALLKVPMIPANVLHSSTQLTVKIVVSNDVNIGTNEDSDIQYGLSDGISFVGFGTVDKTSLNLGLNYFPCFGIEGSSGAILTDVIGINPSSRPKDAFYPSQFVITLKLDAHENWGSCYTAHDGGFVKTIGYNNRLVLSNGLTLEVYKGDKEERAGIRSKLSEPEEPTGEKQKEQENPSIESFFDSREKAPDKETGKASNEDPKSAVLDSIKQDLKADEIEDSVDSELSAIVTSLLTKGMADDK